MSPDRWKEVDDALGPLLSATEAARAATIAHLRTSDAELADELESLLRASDRAEHFLEAPAIEHCLPLIDQDLQHARNRTEAAGQIIGRYRLVSPIGRGGMGDVWLAERADGAFTQRVALKLVKRGMDSDEVLARFRRERQILARLAHPNIARLLDGGLHEDGRPFLVMEYVDGESCITRCSSTSASVEQQLDVFLAVCRAVHFAHQNLVVHGDIKPSNIIIANDGTVKLLDFGIARLLAGDDTFETKTGSSRAITPGYASPEQLDGEPLTTASDIYQLGILLFELLTGTRLQRKHRIGADVGHSALPDGEREAPSVVLRGERELPNAEQRSRRVRGDLDAIVKQALAPDPQRRYTSAANMAEDIVRHLHGSPVYARGVNRRYYAMRFLRKHRAQFATAALFLLASISLITLNTVRLKRERDRALLQATKAGQSAELLAQFFDGWNVDAADRSQVNAAALLRTATMSTEHENENDAEVRASMLSLLGRLNASTGQFAVASSLLDSALLLQRGLPDVDLSELGATLRRRAHLYSLTARYPEAERDLREALALQRATLGASHLETLRSQRELAQTLAYEEHELDALREAQDILSRLATTNRAANQFRSEVRSSIGYFYFRLGRYDEAVAVLDPVLAEQRVLFGAKHMATLFTMRALASTVRDMGSLERAETLYREALRISQALYGPDHGQTFTAELVFALQLHRSWRLDEARALVEESLKRIATLPQEAQDGVRVSAMNQRGLLGFILLDQKQYAAAERQIQQTLVYMRSAYPNGNDEETDYINRLAYIAQLGHRSDAAGLYEDALKVRHRRAAGAVDYATDGLHFLAWVMNERGDRAGSLALYQRIDTLYKRALPPTHPYRLFVEQQLGNARVVSANQSNLK